MVVVTAHAAVHAAFSTDASFSYLRGICSVSVILMLADNQKRGRSVDLPFVSLKIGH